MSSDLIALVVAVTLGIAVVVLGLRRDLSDTTRSWLPRFGGDPRGKTAGLGLYAAGERRRRRISPRQRRWISWGSLLLGLAYAAMAMLSSHERLFHAVFAALWVILAVAYFRGMLPISVAQRRRE